MTKRHVSLVLAVIAVMALCLPAVSSADWTMYVYTENGKNLNVRDFPSTDGFIVGSLPYGTAVTVVSQTASWTRIRWAVTSDDMYVMTRYLVSQKPAPYKPKPGGKTTPASTSTKDSTTVAEINNLLASAASVAPYNVTVRAPRSSGWVTVRWIPTKNSKALATYPDGSQLTVIAVLRDWYQVEDPESGAVGFLYKSYLGK